MLVLRSELLVQHGGGVNLLPVLGGMDRSWTVIHEGLDDCMVDTTLWIMFVSEIKTLLLINLCLRLNY